ncbi:MAG: helix-turn-helix domain-containing protein, partial [Campylobacterota bacterium]|nr:helix-turn-helix domain-containing protein [Campylobacterota bacterium]
MAYNQLTLQERYYIEVEIRKETSQKKIAEALGRSQGSISKEIARNTGQKGYRHKQADRTAKNRH